MENGKIVLHDEFLALIHAELERRMEIAGGMPFLKLLFKNELAPCLGVTGHGGGTFCPALPGL